jgi:hypothetical protein
MAGGKHLGDDFSDFMNKANGPKVRDLFRTFFFRQKGNICGVEPMETMHMKLPEMVNDRHYIILDGAPTLLEKCSRKTVGTGGFVTRHLGDGSQDLFLGEGGAQRR